MIEKDFLPYEESLVLKELGLKIKSPAFYNPNGVLFYKWKEVEENEEAISLLEIIKYYDDVITDRVDVPTFSHAFRWFREKHGLYTHIVPEFYNEGINFNWQILWYLPKERWTKYLVNDGTGLYGDNGEYPTYEEAELACLRKLIEIVKNNK